MTSKTLKTLAALLIAIALSGCVKKPLLTQGPSQGSTMDSIAKMKSIGLVIGCVFAPHDPECVKLREDKMDEKPHKTKEEYNDEVNKEWDNLEKDLKPADQE